MIHWTNNGELSYIYNKTKNLKYFLLTVIPLLLGQLKLLFQKVRKHGTYKGMNNVPHNPPKVNHTCYRSIISLSEFKHHSWVFPERTQPSIYEKNSPKFPKSVFLHCLMFHHTVGVNGIFCCIGTGVGPGDDYEFLSKDVSMGLGGNVL